MIFLEKLDKAMEKSDLCIGLDYQTPRMITLVRDTRDLVNIYKINTKIVYKWEHLLNMVEGIRELNPDAFIIGDCKAGDISSSLRAYYIKAMYDLFDAVTISPFGGDGAVFPWLEDKEKGAFIWLVGTESNDIQKMVYEEVASRYIFFPNMGFVIGATEPTIIDEIGYKYPTVPILTPGIGVQGGQGIRGNRIIRSVSRAIVDRNTARSYL